MLELHCHSSCSDGILSARQLVQASARAGVKALALTDHDTLAGLLEAQAAAQELGLELVPGLELSTTHQGFSLHILGFYPRVDQLTDRLAQRQQARVRRAQRMVEKLADLGMPIQLPAVSAPGRPHLARALVAAGFVASEREAFERYLTQGRPGYEPYEPMSAPEGVRLLRACGAVPVWAHPLLFQGGPTEEVLAALVAAGLQGLEVYRPEITPSQQARLLGYAHKYDLVVTGGSDYHGTRSHEAITLNMLHLPLSLLDGLKARVE
ncbi:PHP domain-containing protein [Anthocerotibacter panamensis]|uniref:PHP domain-containing protein n=1 Tax=Anthocerotibacter panamensis TaxID=2857077 RepID=UPI001C4017D1|nr:PHP domain-containing protein [Anthocerotibacter panamensis]